MMGRVGSWDAAQARMVEGQVAEGELERTGGVTEEGMRKIEDGEYQVSLDGGCAAECGTDWCVLIRDRSPARPDFPGRDPDSAYCYWTRRSRGLA